MRCFRFEKVAMYMTLLRRGMGSSSHIPTSVPALEDYEQAWASGSPREGIRMLLGKLRDDPTNSQLQIELLDMYVGTADYAHGAKLGKQLLEKHVGVNDADVLNQTARCLQKTGDSEGAYELYLKCEAVVPLSILLSDEYSAFTEAQLSRALALIDARVTEDSDAPAQLLHARASIYIKTGDVEEALNMFRRCVDVDKHFAPGYHGLGEALMMKEDYYEALAAFEAFFTAHPNFYSSVHKVADTPKDQLVLLDVTVKRALCFLRVDDWQLAFAQADAAVQLSQVIGAQRDSRERRLVALAHYYRAKARAGFQKDSDDTEAILEDLSEALEADPRSLGARLERSRYYRLTGREEEAVQDEAILESLLERKT